MLPAVLTGNIPDPRSKIQNTPLWQRSFYKHRNVFLRVSDRFETPWYTKAIQEGCNRFKKVTANSTIRNRGYGLVEESCLLENGQCLAVPVRRGRRSELEDGRASKSDADPMGYNWVVDLIASVLILRALLIESRDLKT